MARATYRRKNLFGPNGSGEIRVHLGGEAWHQASGIVVRAELKDTSLTASITQRKQTGRDMKLSTLKAFPPVTHFLQQG